MKTIRERAIWFLLALAIGSVIAFGESSTAGAQTTASPAPAMSASPAPTPTPSPTPPPPFFSGYLDGTYENLSANPANYNVRVFDKKKSGPLFNTANVVLQVVPSSGFGGRIEFNAGNDAPAIQSWPVYANGLQTCCDLTQAYVTWTNNAGNLTLQAGKYFTLAGGETPRSPDQVNISRALDYFGGYPTSHTGGRITWVVSSKVTLIGGINRGWDQLVGGFKTLEGGIDLTPSSTTTLNLSGYSGNQCFGAVAGTFTLGTTTYAGNGCTNSSGGFVNGSRSLLDVVGAWKPPGPIAYTVNYDYGTQNNAVCFNGAGTQLANCTAHWTGLVGYATYTFSPLWAATVRGEVFDDTNGYRTGFAQNLSEGTFTLQYNPDPNVIVRGEVRGDTSNQAVFYYGPNFSTLPAGVTLVPAKGQTSEDLELIVRY